MQSSTFTFVGADGVEIDAYRWLPEGDPAAVVQIAHGMAEHAARYERFAAALTGAGYAVYAEDHRGHGQTAERTGVGYLSDADGFDTVVADIDALFRVAGEEYPDAPKVLFGHSMGSMLARHYAVSHSQDIAALVLSGTAADPGVLGKVGRLVASAEAKVRGARTPSPLMNAMVFGQYNKAFKPTRTDFDWLSRDEAEVDAYVADPLCGQVFSSGFYADILSGLGRINQDTHVAGVRHDLPILLVAGSKDPVGDNGKGVSAVGEQYRRLGVRDVTVTLYADARHEILNETNRDDVTTDILRWLAERLTTSS